VKNNQKQEQTLCIWQTLTLGLYMFLVQLQLFHTHAHTAYVYHTPGQRVDNFTGERKCYQTHKRARNTTDCQ